MKSIIRHTQIHYDQVFLHKKFGELEAPSSQFPTIYFLFVSSLSPPAALLNFFYFLMKFLKYSYL